MCRVLNKHKTGVPSGAVYIGRGSKWGNPFHIGAEGDRATVITKHESWLRDQHHLLRALDELRSCDLVCFCAPLPVMAICCCGSRAPRATSGSRGGGGWPQRIAVRARDAIRHTRRLLEAEDGRDGFEPVGVERAPLGSTRPCSSEVPQCQVSPAPR